MKRLPFGWTFAFGVLSFLVACASFVALVYLSLVGITRLFSH